MTVQANVWTPVPGCGGAGPLELNLPFMEVLTVTGPNTTLPLTHTPDGALFILFINGYGAPAASPAPYTLSGNNIVWQSQTFGFSVYDRVIAVYTYTGGD